MEIIIFFVKTIVRSFGWIHNFLKSKKGKKAILLKDAKKRKTKFKYLGMTDKSGVKAIVFFKIKEENNCLEILFAAFNDRYSFFKPIGNYNLNSPKRQKNIDHGDKNYVKKYEEFHSKRMVPFTTENNSYQEKKDFLELLTDKKRLIYIAGSVGCGKSTFISHLMYCAKQEITDNKSRIAVISASAKKLDDTSEVDGEKVIFQMIESSFRSNFKQVNISNAVDFHNVVVKHFTTHKLTIIIDDLDQIYDQSRVLMLYSDKFQEEFDKHFKSMKYVHIAIKLFTIIKKLLDDNDNVKFIIGLRNETLQAINLQYTKDTGSVSLEKLINHSIINIKHTDINHILKQRFCIMSSSSVDENEDRIKVFRKFATEFANEFDGLHINGTRHIISTLRRLSCIDSNKNFFYPQWMLQLYIYLDGIQKYSQQACGILNIFLVNIDYRKDVDGHNTQCPGYAKKDHYQTYWLKYVVCKYFDEIIKGRAVDINIIYREFIEYEREIFNFSLYSLTDPNHGRLISCSHSVNAVDNEDYCLEGTNRLKYCFEKKNIF